MHAQRKPQTSGMDVFLLDPNRYLGRRTVRRGSATSLHRIFRDWHEESCRLFALLSFLCRSRFLLVLRLLFRGGLGGFFWVCVFGSWLPVFSLVPLFSLRHLPAPPSLCHCVV